MFDVESGDWRLETGMWNVETRIWKLEFGDVEEDVYNSPLLHFSASPSLPFFQKKYCRIDILVFRPDTSGNFAQSDLVVV